MTIESFSIDYDAKNEENVFARGDAITGKIMLVVSSEVKVSSLSIKAKGKAEVCWTERYGQVQVTYYAKEKYFSMEDIILKEGREDGSDVVTPGRHVHPFSFQIPDQDMPSSFKGSAGKIIYTLEARLSRSMRLDSKAKSEFTVVSKPDTSQIPDLMEPQDGNKDKDVKFFASGNVSMNIHTERMGYLQGEELKVRAEIVNNSTRSVTPKFYLYEKQSAFAKGKRRLYTHDVLKEKGEPVPAGTQQSVTKVLTIPPQLPASILNCPLLKLEYRLKVVLDIKLSRDPAVKLPIVVLPATEAPRQKPPDTQAPQERPPPYNEIGFEPFGTATQPAWNNVAQCSDGVYSLPPAYPSNSDFGDVVMEEKK